MCTDGKPCPGATLGAIEQDFEDLKALGEQEIKEIAATMKRIKALHKQEVTYRTFILIGLVHQAEDLAKQGMEYVTDGQLVDATSLFHELQDCRKAMNWLLELPKELCPKVTPTEDTPQAAKMQAHSMVREIMNLFAESAG